MDGMREIRFFSKALFVGFKPRKESLLYVFNSIPYCGSEDISWVSRKNLLSRKSVGIKLEVEGKTSFVLWQRNISKQ